MRLSLPIDHPDRVSERSWFMTKEEAEAKEYDIKAVNVNAPDFSDKRTSAELIEVIMDAQKAIADLINELSKT
jgi:type I restriction enzyme M protein